MKLGSKEHKKQYCEELIKTYHENIWNDEIYFQTLQDQIGGIRKQLAAIDLAIDRKEFKSKNEGEKAKFVAQRELKKLEDEMVKITEKVNVTWPSRIEQIQKYMEEGK
jgi:SMC interacting uncharacterized protein involved in chromosome segregation